MSLYRVKYIENGRVCQTSHFSNWKETVDNVILDSMARLDLDDEKMVYGQLKRGLQSAGKTKTIILDLGQFEDSDLDARVEVESIHTIPSRTMPPSVYAHLLA